MHENKAVILYALKNKGIELDLKKNHHAYEEFVEKNIILMKSKGSVPLYLIFIINIQLKIVKLKKI